MKLFSMLMARRFFRPFLFGLGLFALMIFLGDIFDKMHHLVKSKASLGTILKYLWLEVPYWTVRVIPMATLLATLIALTGFIRSGEWIAAQSSGFKSSNFWIPLLWCSLAVTGLSFLAQETVLPVCYRRAKTLWRESIHPEWEWDKYLDVALLGGPGQFLQARVFLPKDGRLERPILEQVGDDGVESQIDAQLALWDGLASRWIFHDGVERRFSDGEVRENAFLRKESDFTAPPRSLIPISKSPEEMSSFELRRYARGRSPLGASRREMQVAAHAKLAYPFTNFILCALGIPIALRLRGEAKALSFFAALVLSFFYLWCLEVGRSLGLSGRLPPLAAAWSANIAFAALAAELIRRYDA